MIYKKEKKKEIPLQEGKRPEKVCETSHNTEDDTNSDPK